MHHDPEDQIRRNVEKESVQEECSPMDPPDAYNPPGKITVNIEDMHPFLKGLIDDHNEIKGALEGFETAVRAIRETGVTPDSNRAFAQFFRTFDDVFLAHDKKEEKYLFPVLESELIKKGEHSKGSVVTTATDVMEEDHVRIIQLASVIFNFFGLASRLTDTASRNIVLDAALSQADELIELMRLHIFREDTIVFPLAHQLIDSKVLTSFMIEHK
ncbi:MAG: hemerythrin domain-containing protein [Candidatus Omnitrophica bacterium]|nr:hemerythrin domain-containing protein [Candidatus Omnitrophota bacterium]